MASDICHWIISRTIKPVSSFHMTTTPPLAPNSAVLCFLLFVNNCDHLLTKNALTQNVEKKTRLHFDVKTDKIYIN